MKQRHRTLTSIAFVLVVTMPALTSCSRWRSVVLDKVWIEYDGPTPIVMVFTNREPADELLSFYHPEVGKPFRKGSKPRLMVQSILGGRPDRLMQRTWLYDISREGNSDRQQIKMLNIEDGTILDMTFDEKKNMITRYYTMYFPAERSAAEKTFLSVCGEVADLIVAVKTKPSQEEAKKLRSQLAELYAKLPSLAQLLNPPKRR